MNAVTSAVEGKNPVFRQIAVEKRGILTLECVLIIPVSVPCTSSSPSTRRFYEQDYCCLPFRLRPTRTRIRIMHVRRITDWWKGLHQLWQGTLDCVPDNRNINIEISMGDAVAHPFHAIPRNRWIAIKERVIIAQQPGCHLTDDDKIQHNCLLGPLVGQKSYFIHAVDIAARLSSGSQHVVKIIRQAKVFAHTGCALAITCSLNFGERSAGVRRSTGTPSKLSNSTCNPPRSKSVAPGKGSTSRSKSLPSRSCPIATDPNTRGFSVRNRLTAARTAIRCDSKATEGFTRHPLSRLNS